MYQLVIRPTAIIMAENAYDWYEKQQIGLGESFLYDLKSCYDKLKTSPVSYTKIRKDFRQIILQEFPYVVVYIIEKENVVVYSVFHTSRNPRKKFRK